MCDDLAGAGVDRSEVKRRYNLARSSDPVLSAVGQDQVERLPGHPALASLLRSGRPVDVYASPLRRAIETAAPLQKVLLNAPVIRLRADLSEIGAFQRPRFTIFEFLDVFGKCRKHILIFSGSVGQLVAFSVSAVASG